MYGRVDRGGGREGSKKSLRKNKTTIADKLKHLQQPAALATERPTKSLPPPPLARRAGSDGGSSSSSSSNASMIDAGCSLLSRRFESDLTRVVQRALNGNVEAMVVISSDIDKQEQVRTLVRQYPGALYACIGVHPDNVKKVNDKVFVTKTDQLRDALLEPEVVAVFAGLDFTRDFATRFPQEKVFTNMFELAIELDLPLVISSTEATEKVLEKLHEFGSSIRGAALYNFLGSPSDFQQFVDIAASVPLYFVVTGIVCDATSPTREMLPLIPRDRLILATDSPRYTPQTIEDVYLRAAKNEPSNLPYVYATVSELLAIPLPELQQLVRHNIKTFFGLRDATEEEQAATMQHGDDEEGDEVDGEEDATCVQSSSDAVGSTTETPADDATPPLATATETTTTTTPTPATGGLETSGNTVEEIKYACSLCRKVLVPSSKEILPHEEGLALLKDSKRSRNDVEFDSSNIVFVRELPWLREQASAEGLFDDVAYEIDAKINCPHCGRKNIGKILAPSGSGGAVAYMLKRKTLDVILEGVDPRASGRMMEDDMARDEQDDDDDDDDDPRHGKKKRRRKQQKAANLSNMGNFRNKSYGVAKTNSKKKKPSGKHQHGGDGEDD